MKPIPLAIAALFAALAFSPAAAFAQQEKRQGLKDRILDAEFDAWSKEWLDFDLSAARKAWSEVATVEDMSIRARARAYNRAVFLSRLSGDFKDLSEASRLLSASPTIYAGHRMLLMSYLVTLQGLLADAERVMKRVFKDYDAALEKATQADGRERARASLFSNLRQTAKRIRSPASGLLPDPWRVDQRAFLLNSNANARGSRDLLTQIKQVQSLQKKISEARKAKGSRRLLTRLITNRDKLRSALRVRATRAIRSFRIDILEFERENNSSAAESLVDIVLQIERALWPRGRVNLSLRDALEDPVYRRSAISRVHAVQERRVKKLRSENSARAESLANWRSTVQDLMRLRAWGEAAALTLEELQSDPAFLNFK